MVATTLVWNATDGGSTWYSITRWRRWCVANNYNGRNGFDREVDHHGSTGGSDNVVIWTWGSWSADSSLHHRCRRKVTAPGRVGGGTGAGDDMFRSGVLAAANFE